MSSHDEPRPHSLPADLDAALSRHFPGGDELPSWQRLGDARNALEVLARVLPYVEDTEDVIAEAFPGHGPRSPDTARAMAALGGANPPGESTFPTHEAVPHQFDQLLEQLAEGALRLATGVRTAMTIADRLHHLHAATADKVQTSPPTDAPPPADLL
ncbi:hypothetical protein [Amycolatopsis sp. NPDC051903]|uniref:hypothetical protein n=1 Tax=Amycolatopsis sp. NPDC051903 TaxID=3363936 RepID=UPI0037B53885